MGRLSDSCSEPVNRAVDQIYSIWEETRPDRLTQLVFVDFSTPDPVRFNVYHDVRAKLIARGVPETDIAFIHDAKTDAAKKALFDAVNAGRVRILGGSTEKMGAGTNVQQRLIALHHLDAPWRPRDIEQREGRILRQGNRNAQVRIFRYVTEGSFDAYMWQVLETKARFIAQVMTGQTSVRCAEDLETGALTYAEIKAIASGNPTVIEKVKIDTEIRKLDQLRAVHQNQQYKISWQLRELPARIAQARGAVADITADIATRDGHIQPEFSMIVCNRTFTGKGAREEAGKALTQAILSWQDDLAIQPHATYRGFTILSRGNRTAPLSEPHLPAIFVQGVGLYSANLNAVNPVGTIQSIEYVLRSLDDTRADRERTLADLTKALEDYRAQAGRPFEHEARLATLLARQAELNAALDLDKDEQQTAEPEPSDVAA